MPYFSIFPIFLFQYFTFFMKTVIFNVFFINSGRITALMQNTEKKHPFFSAFSPFFEKQEESRLFSFFAIKQVFTDKHGSNAKISTFYMKQGAKWISLYQTAALMFINFQFLRRNTALTQKNRKKRAKTPNSHFFL